MYGKKFSEINTKKIAKYDEKKSYKLAKLFCEKEYSLFKLVLLDSKNILIKENNFLLISKINDEKIYSSFIKKNNLVLNKNISNTYFICFQKKKNNISLLTVKNTIIKPSFKTPTINKNKLQKKYWGKMVTLLENDKGSIKIINMLKNTQSSMEFHINKKESYFICSGKIKLGMRYSRAKQKSLILNKNNSFLMKPGTMHMRMSLNDTFILEMST
jgi:mannose-6-phosphate isomerase-like protein (cupin superfamily)